ncbi:MAG: hypothetical protein ABI307_14395 [Mycobacterium sp.]
MSGVHSDLGELGPELRRLAQAVLDGIDPAVRAAAVLASGAEPGKCQQVWCPLCALVAMVSGEEHPLLTVIAEHSVALFEVIRAVVGAAGGPPTPPKPPEGPPKPPEGPPEPPEGPPEGPPGGDAGGPVKTGYQHIPVTVKQ